MREGGRGRDEEMAKRKSEEGSGKDKVKNRRKRG